VQINPSFRVLALVICIGVILFSIWQDDAHVVVELPDDISTAAVGLGLNAAGLVKISIAVLLTPTDFNAAFKKLVSYRPLGEKTKNYTLFNKPFFESFAIRLLPHGSLI
jgi:hypothetical protein